MSNELADFVCEVGIKFYKKGQFSEALQEFQTVLTIDPQNETAQKYIALIESQIAAPITITPSSEEQTPLRQKSVAETSPAARIFPEAQKEKTLDEFMLKMQKELSGEIYQSEEEAKAALLGQEALPKILVLDAEIKNLKFPLEIEQSKSIIMQGKNIRRFLITEPEILIPERINANEIKFTGKSLGYVYLHIWDEQERWTLEFLVIPLRPTMPTLEEEMRRTEETAKNIRLSYSFDWSFVETGRRLDSLKRSSYTTTHSFGLVGTPETPYGNLNFRSSVSSVEDQTRLNYFSLGLHNGKFGQFKDFNLNTFDYNPAISNLAFSGSNLRGVMLNSPAFDKKIEYTTFWGREGGGRYAGLSPGLAKIKNSFNSGLDVRYFPKEKQSYSASVFHGWGRQRLADLPSYTYDLSASNKYNSWDWKYEIANDSDVFSHLLKTGYKFSKGKISNELRESDKRYSSLNSLGYKTGELGLLTSFDYKPFANFAISSRLDVYKDRLYPNPDSPEYWNEDFEWNSNLLINPLTSLNSHYGLQNDLGKVSAYRSHDAGIGLSRTFEWIRRINTNINYRYGIYKYFTSPSSDYISNKILLGLRFNLIGAWEYYANEDLGWVEPLNSADGTASPRAFETGLGWQEQIFKSPFYGNMRLAYRDEENSSSAFSFLSGEDYIEQYAELSFKPKPEIEVFVNERVRNVWAEKAEVKKRVDLTFYSGLRYGWDTGLRWESVGTVEGYVFKDLNSDGLRQRDEAPIEGIKVWLGKDKFQVTDIFGYYKFKKVRARKVFANIDTTTIPTGFVLTGPATQEVAIAQGQRMQANFGIISRTEITGIVFEDLNGDGEYSLDDKGVAGVVFRLEDGTEAKTDDYGRYTFSNLTAGKHKITLDLISLPTIYIPNVSIFRDVDLMEGASYNYNIPVQKIGE